jgi:hypothetical protein
MHVCVNARSHAVCVWLVFVHAWVWSRPPSQPWAYVLRDVLRYARTAEEATSIMNNAYRTCPIFVGVGQMPSGSPVADAQFVTVE